MAAGLKNAVVAVHRQALHQTHTPVFLHGAPFRRDMSMVRWRKPKVDAVSGTREGKLTGGIQAKCLRSYLKETDGRLVHSPT